MEGVPYELMREAAECCRLDPYSSLSPRFVSVLDADALLSSIDNHCRTGRPSRILRLAESRTSIVYAEDHVYGETYRGITKLAISSSASVGQLSRLFEEEYLPVLRWVDVDGAGVGDDRVNLVMDDTDVPTAQLASLIAPCLVLSEDKHLRDPGFAPPKWRDAAGLGTEIARAAAEQEGVVMAVGLPVAVVLRGGFKLGGVAKLPWWLTAGLMAGGGYLVLRSPERRRAISTKGKPALDAILEVMARAAEQERANRVHLKELMFEPVGSPTLKQQIATVLSRTREPLLAKEVQELISRHFDDVGTVDEIREVLCSGAEFIQAARCRWAFGRIGGASS